MNKINWSRVVLGGMLAGVVLMILGAASTLFILGRRLLQTAAQAFRPSPSGLAAALFVLCAFLFLGTLMTWWYAAMRPLFGAGLKTAAIAGLALWVTAVCLGVVGFAIKSVVMGEAYPLPRGPMLPMLYLIITIVGTVSGASVYRAQQNQP